MSSSEAAGQREVQGRGRESADQAGCASPQSGNCLSVRPGQLCPVCGKGIMNYDGLLILGCAVCGFKETGGGFT
ncbi:MAG TPA: hypothetical protein PKK59_05005 [Anaerolineaceae bacterium]|nr:hypothetical protein [Anaerolineaceae bacterium]